MDQPKKFKFTLNIRDVETEELTNAPDGWLKTKITYKVDTFYKALRRNLTIPLKFVRKGAFLLRREAYTYALLARVNINIGRLSLSSINPSEPVYDTLYEGRLDFSTGDDSEVYYTLDSISKDFTIQVDAYDSTKFSVPLTGPDVIDVILPALTLQETADFIIVGRGHFNDNQFPEMDLVNNTQVASQNSVQAVPYGQLEDPDFANTGNWFYRATMATKVNMQVIGLSFVLTGVGTHAINIYNQNGTNVKTIYVATTGVLPEEVVVNSHFVLDVAKGDKLFIYCQGPHAGGGFNFTSGTVSISYNTSTPPTKCKGIRAYDLYKRLLKLMNTTSPNEPNQDVPNQSYLLDPALDGVFKNLVYTCSDSVRAFYVDPNGHTLSTSTGRIYNPGDTLQSNGKYLVLNDDVVYNDITYHPGDVFSWVLGQDQFTSENGFVRQTASTPGLIMSFKDDFFQDMLALQFGQVAFGIQRGVAVLEDLSYFYRPGSGALDLGIVDNKTSIRPAVDKLFNSIKGGYKTQQYDLVNGRTEVNAQVIYTTDVLTPVKQVNFQASSRADSTGIEITRVTPVDTSSSRSDNDNIMLMIKDNPDETGAFPVSTVSDLPSYSGVDGSFYNWFITPKQNFWRGSRFLRSVFDRMDGYTIRVASAAKNTALITVDADGKQVSESAVETISASFGPKIFLPWYATVNAGLPINAIDLIDNNPYSDIGFTWNGVTLRGFPEEINVDAGENSPQSFKMLLSPSNNLLDLIR